jgi:hypothetical protein
MWRPECGCPMAHMPRGTPFDLLLRRHLAARASNGLRFVCRMADAQRTCGPYPMADRDVAMQGDVVRYPNTGGL